MLHKVRRLPSPAIVISAIALIVAVGGGSFAIASLNSGKVKRIAKKAANKQITKRAPGLSVSHANSANTANSATNATNAGTASNANALGGLGASAYAHVAQQSFIAPTLNAGYSNYNPGDSQAGYMKDSLGFVHLSGVLNCPTTSASAFTLPVGFRPGKDVGMIGTGFDSKGLEVFIFTNGQVDTDATGSGFCGLDGIVFPAAGTAGTSPASHSGTGGADPAHK